MAKRNKQAKKNSEHQDDQSKQSEKKVDLSGTFVDTVKDALTIFSKISESERNSLYGNQAFLDQFRECFKINNPGVLDGIKKEDMPRYLAILEKK